MSFGTPGLEGFLGITGQAQGGNDDKMITALIGHFGFLCLESQDVFEVKVVDAVLDGEPKDISVVVAFDLVQESRGRRLSGWV